MARWIFPCHRACSLKGRWTGITSKLSGIFRLCKIDQASGRRFSPQMNFASALSDAELNLHNNGFSTTLWQPDLGWGSTESEASNAPFNPQLLAALQIFLWFFIADSNRTWVHLAAEMQAGKTGVVTALIRLIFTNISRIPIKPERIFILTGMSDNAWIKQTCERLPANVRNGVAHSGGFPTIQKKLRSLAGREYLRDILIVFDESHIASLGSNRPNKLIYEQVALLCPRELWKERNIHFLTISATDPGKSSICSEDTSGSSKVVRLLTNEKYQSVEFLNTSSRIRYNDTFGELHEAKAIVELQRAVAEFTEPLYHILRPRVGKQKKVEELLTIAFPGCLVIPWDSTTKRANDGESSSTAITDINELLAVQPERHTFILLKMMFYASKTMDDTYVGVLWDRKGGKDDTNLQSLLGRALGYEKSKRTVVYTSKDTVENYLGFWKDAIAGLPLPTGIPIEKIDRLDKKMAGIKTVRVINGKSVMTIARNFMGPGGGSGAVAPPVVEKPPPNVEEFQSMELLKARWNEIQTSEGVTKRHIARAPNQKDGFFTCAIGQESEKQTTKNVRIYINGNWSGWGSGLTKAEAGDLIHRVYVGYENDVATFFLRWGKK